MDILGIDLSLFDDNYKTKEPEIEFLVMQINIINCPMEDFFVSFLIFFFCYFLKF